jgi:hypothetical protein
LSRGLVSKTPLGSSTGRLSNTVTGYSINHLGIVGDIAFLLPTNTQPGMSAASLICAV